MSIISTKYLLQDAQAKGYAVPAFNIHNAETIQAILEVCSEMQSPVILAGTPGTFKHIARRRSTRYAAPTPPVSAFRWLCISITMNRWKIFAGKWTQAYAAP